MAYKNLESIPTDLSENKAGRFISLSVMLHAVLVTIVTLMAVPSIEFPQKEVVEFEVESETIGATPIADGTNVPESLGKVAPAPKSAPVQNIVSSAPVTATATAAPATLDDITTPDLESSENTPIAAAVLDEKDLQDDFDKVDQENSKALVAAKKSIQDEADQAAQANEEALNELEKENQLQAKAIAAAEEARRKENLAAIAALQAKERAAAEAETGEGTGRSGSPAPTKEVAGIPGGVRTLEQLRPQPGNRFPDYSREERLARQEGLGKFYAYVNKDGSLSQFKLGQSTGHRNLDSKTLAAYKKWKFYPGQEGWVEMPFKWTLNGDAMEAGGRLRK